MARKRKSQMGEKAELNMTPMIDVVFQLLIFFVVTIKQEDILARLDVNRPAPETPPEKIEEIELLTIQVYKEGFVLQGKRVTLEELTRQMERVAGLNKNVSVVIKCTADSPHAYLMQALDACANAKLTNLNVFSM
jgi:biopolymer transport protein ExbD